MDLEIVIVTDIDGSLQAVLPSHNFNEQFKEWFKDIHAEDKDAVLSLTFDPKHRFEKFEQVEIIVESEGDENNFLVQKASIQGDLPSPSKYLLEYNDYESRTIAIVEASTTEELRRKCMLACKEEMGADEEDLKIDSLISLENFGWGVSSAFKFMYMEDGESSEEEIRITKLVNY